MPRLLGRGTTKHENRAHLTVNSIFVLINDLDLPLVHSDPIVGIRPLSRRGDFQIFQGIMAENFLEILADPAFIHGEIFGIQVDDP
jgi:hypothetical protein